MAESYDEPSMTKGNSKSYTANPRAPRGGEIDEPTGPITSDSLANESIQSGGGFNDNSNPAVLGVKGSNSTLANTDTSGARQLHAATDAETRDGDRFTTESYDNDDIDTSSSRGVYNTQRNRADDGTAPAYADNAAGRPNTQPYNSQRPKGSNLVENDDDIPPNRSTFTGDVGGPKDPGRLAEANFNASNATSGADAGYPKDTGAVDDGSKFDSLDPSERT